MNKLFDLRFVIGAFFTTVGLLLLLYGLFTHNNAENAHIVNRWCGGIFTIFGIFMIIVSYQKSKNNEVVIPEE